MQLSFFNWRRLIKPISFLTSVSAICVFIASVIALCIEGFVHTYLWMLIGSVSWNYLITLLIVLRLLNYQKVDPLFINCYLFLFLIFPFAGIIFYVTVDFYLMHKDYGNKYMDIYLKYKRYETSHPINIDNGDFLMRPFLYNYKKYKSPIYRGSAVSVLRDPYQILKELVEIIDSAKKFIHMEFYLFSDGLVLDHVKETLEKKIKQGVEVKLIVDYWGNLGRIKKKTIKGLQRIGVNVKWFNPAFRFNYLCRQFRNHNKIVVVDNQYAWFGSCNIADEYFNITDKHFQTTEISAKLTGHIVSSVNALFFTHWELIGLSRGQKVDIDADNLHDYFCPPEARDSEASKSVLSQFIDNSPISNELIIRDNLMQLITGAQKSIVISTPYFFPPDDLINALKFARSMGVKVKILVPKNPDLIDFFRTLNRQKFELLLNEGIEIYEYFGFNHEKLMIVDEEIVYFGSYNWDYRSLYLNFENALLLKCGDISNELSSFMEEQFSNSHKIGKEDIRKFEKFPFFNSFIRLFKAFL